MTPALRKADQDLLHQLLLGQLPSAEAERLAAEYADDGRLAELAESLAGKDDTLLDLLRHHDTVVDPDAERLVGRLLERLQLDPKEPQRDDTAALSDPHATSDPGSPAAASGIAPLPEQLEHYRPLRELGHGGMGTVYLAQDTRLHREVALKTLRPELAAKPQAKERFLREARLAASLEHDNIVHIYHVGEVRGIPFLAMQLLKGRSLEDLLRHSRTLTIDQVLQIGIQIGEGLAAAHERGMIHRDIKPANIWIEASGGGRVKILDFGLARISQGDTGITQTGDVVGTPAYMPPEQARGEKIDHRCDLYSLGCVLYRMATGELPLKGNDTMSMLMALALNEPIVPTKLNAKIPQGLSDLIMKLLAKDPSRRLGSAREVVEALKAIQRGDSAAAPNDNTAVLSASMLQPPSEAPMAGPKSADPYATLPTLKNTSAPATVVPPRRTGPRRRRVPILAAVALLVLGIGGAILFGGQIIRVATNQGELVIVVDDPAVEVKIVHNGVVVQDKPNKREFTLTAGKGEIEVLEKDGIKLATRRFELTRGGTTTVRVTLEELAEVRNADRLAAEWALSIGGSVGIKRKGGKVREIVAAGDLPEGTIALMWVNLNENQKVSDAGLAHFKNCKNLTELHVRGTLVTDAGLAHVKDCKNLDFLDLNGTQVSDAGLALFKECRNLSTLDLNHTRVGDTGLVHLAGYSSLIGVNVKNTKVTEAGVKKLATALPGCTIAWDGGDKVGTGWTHLFNRKDLTGWTTEKGGVGYWKVVEGALTCSGPRDHLFSDRADFGDFHLRATVKINDQGNSGIYFRAGKPLAFVGDYEAQICTRPDQQKTGSLYGLAVVHEILVQPETWFTYEIIAQGNRLRLLVNGKVTADYRETRPDRNLAGYFALQHLDAKTAVFFRSIEVKSLESKVSVDPDRRAAEWVLSIGGTIKLKEKDQERQIGAVGDLPRGEFALTLVGLNQNPKVSDAGLALFRDCKNVLQLFLERTQVTDAGLAHFKECKNLTFLDLRNTQVSDLGLVHLKDCKNLTGLGLVNTKVSDAGLAHFKDCKNLSQLYLDQTQVSDAGLAQLKDCKNLTLLNLQKTKVTAAKIEELRKALPNCKIESDHGTFGPK